uniref:Tetratricopeptide repeat domain 16 n=1 Tax=Mus musculus TaxID=10090 RepID=E0CXL5_MOUSE
MTDRSKEPHSARSQKTPKLKVPEAPEKILRRIFGTSHVFYVMTDPTKRRMIGSTVPAKVREYPEKVLGWSQINTRSTACPVLSCPVLTAITKAISASYKRTGRCLCCSSPVPSTWTPNW